MSIDLKQLAHRILEEYALPWCGTHGVGHWARVLRNGLRLAELTGAKVEVVQLFALFHDSRRINEGTDPGHGQRGAEFATELRGDLFDLSDADFELLRSACTAHTDGGTTGHVTVRTCFDADRLDLGRVGTYPQPGRLCTDAAKSPAMIRWADGRAAVEAVPDFVREEWGIELEGW